ncbi:MAG: hypothetical protein JRN10_00940 [Nitrososphaerota archaeon]|nr:hypothetical protein [Nitrososphaerota archaeon]MDG6929803.1 hypothetical protein [Nitrososphaerota archaeon]
MSYDYARIKLKIGVNEIELSGQKADMEFLSALAMKMFDEASSAPNSAQNEQRASQAELNAADKGYPAESGKVPDRIEQLPQVSLEPNGSLPINILRLFSAEWGKKPRRLAEVKEILDNYGMVYPKQTVAVTLLRLAKEGKIRRFKSERGEYVYVSSATVTVSQLIKQGEI